MIPASLEVYVRSLQQGASQVEEAGGATVEKQVKVERQEGQGFPRQDAGGEGRQKPDSGGGQLPEQTGKPQFHSCGESSIKILTPYGEK